MNVSGTLPNDSTSLDELAADLSQNQDEVLDLELALGALGGLRHSAACDAAERSTRRFDERQHRLHEARMKALGMEGEEPKETSEDMGHQVLIRSPTIHNHYQGNGAPSAPSAPQQPSAPPAAAVDFPAWAKAAILASVLGSGAGAGIGLYSLFADRSQNVTNITEGKDTGIGLVPPGKPFVQE